MQPMSYGDHRNRPSLLDPSLRRAHILQLAAVAAAQVTGAEQEKCRWCGSLVLKHLSIGLGILYNTLYIFIHEYVSNHIESYTYVHIISYIHNTSIHTLIKVMIFFAFKVWHSGERRPTRWPRPPQALMLQAVALVWHLKRKNHEDIWKSIGILHQHHQF